jgi:ribonuclease BN (tRNA processing enzyme)
MADSVARRREAAARPPIVVHALPQTIEALKAHLFNGIIWPDFSRIPSAGAPILRFQALAVGERLAVGGRCIEVLPAAHTVPAVGFAVFANPAGAGPAWVYTGDTGPNAALWARLAQIEVACLVIETAFRDEEAALAQRSGHLHPARLGTELRRLAAPAAVHITHIKPGEVETVMAQIAAQDGRHAIRALQTGQVLTVNA